MLPAWCWKFKFYFSGILVPEPDLAAYSRCRDRKFRFDRIVRKTERKTHK